MSPALKLSVAEFDTIVAKGAFDELTQKIELINGEIQAMNPAGPVHDDYIAYLTEWSVRNTDPNEVRIRVQSGLSLPDLDSRPEPDVVWVKARRYVDGHPTADDVLLLIEVSDSGLKSDQQDKEELYAKAGIVEFWIVDIQHELIHVHREPSGGKYRSVTNIESGQSIAPLVQPETMLITTGLFVHGEKSP